MKKVIRLTENELVRLVSRVIKEQTSVKVSIEGDQPISGTDWDMVHGYFGSKRLDDDLEERVSKKLLNGNYRVEDVDISSQVEGNKIVSKGSVTLRSVGPNEKPHKYFTTRGSIGESHKERHDQQVDGLVNRLKGYYKTDGVEEFGPFTVKIKGTSVSYTQSFFAIEGPSSSVNSLQPTKTTSPSKTTTKSTQNYVLTASGKNFQELNQKFKEKSDDRLKGEKYKVEEMSLTESNGGLFLKLTLKPDQSGSSKLRFLGNPKTVTEPYRTIDLALEKNPNSKLLKSGVTQLTNNDGVQEDFEFHILGLD